MMTNLKAELVEKTLAISEIRIGEFKTSIIKLQRRAQKLDCGEISFVIGEPYYKETRTGEDDFFSGLPRTRKVKYFPVSVSGTAPVLAGWLFVAKVEHDPEIGNIISVLPNQILPERYRAADLYNCDHCKKRLFRRDTFVVQNQDSGEYQQIGRQCLRDFLGHKSPEAVAKYFEFLSLVFDMSDDWSNEDMGKEGSGGRRQIFYDDVKSFLIQTSAVIRAYGWCSKKLAAEVDGKISTASEVSNRIWNKDYKPKHDIVEITEQDKTNAIEAAEWFLSQTDQNSDYIYNTRKLAEVGVMRERHAGLVASMMFIYLREKGRIEQKVRFVSEYFGEIKQRLSLGELTLSSVYGPIEGEFGPTYIYRFMNEKHLFVWFTGKCLKTKVGDKVMVTKATIKDHKEYKGQKETIITRAALVTN